MITDTNRNVNRAYPNWLPALAQSQGFLLDALGRQPRRTLLPGNRCNYSRAAAGASCKGKLPRHTAFWASV
jgi:hypothetical protein